MCTRQQHPTSDESAPPTKARCSDVVETFYTILKLIETEIDVHDDPVELWGRCDVLFSGIKCPILRAATLVMVADHSPRVVNPVGSAHSVNIQAVTALLHVTNQADVDREAGILELVMSLHEDVRELCLGIAMDLQCERLQRYFMKGGIYAEWYESFPHSCSCGIYAHVMFLNHMASTTDGGIIELQYWCKLLDVTPTTQKHAGAMCIYACTAFARYGASTTSLSAEDELLEISHAKGDMEATYMLAVRKARVHDDPAKTAESVELLRLCAQWVPQAWGFLADAAFTGAAVGYDLMQARTWAFEYLRAEYPTCSQVGTWYIGIPRVYKINFNRRDDFFGNWSRVILEYMRLTDPATLSSRWNCQMNYRPQANEMKITIKSANPDSPEPFPSLAQNSDQLETDTTWP